MIGVICPPLDRTKVVFPLNRFRLLTSSNFKWRKNGPIQRFFREQVQKEFLDSTFSEEGARLRFVGGMLSRGSLRHMQNAIDRLARELDELSRKDAALPLSERSACSAMLAMRPWEFSMFEKLRRKN